MIKTTTKTVTTTTTKMISTTKMTKTTTTKMTKTTTATKMTKTRTKTKTTIRTLRRMVLEEKKILVKRFLVNLTIQINAAIFLQTFVSILEKLQISI